MSLFGYASAGTNIYDATGEEIPVFGLILIIICCIFIIYKIACKALEIYKYLNDRGSYRIPVVTREYYLRFDDVEVLEYIETSL